MCSKNKILLDEKKVKVCIWKYNIKSSFHHEIVRKLQGEDEFCLNC